MGWFNTGHEEFCVQLHPLKLWTRPNGHPMVGGSKHHLCKQKAHLRQPSPAWNMNWTYDDVQVQRPNNFGWFTHVCFLLLPFFSFLCLLLLLPFFFHDVLMCYSHCPLKGCWPRKRVPWSKAKHVGDVDSVYCAKGCHGSIMPHKGALLWFASWHIEN